MRTRTRVDDARGTRSSRVAAQKEGDGEVGDEKEQKVFEGDPNHDDDDGERNQGGLGFGLGLGLRLGLRLGLGFALELG